MIYIRLSKFQSSKKFSVELENFEPRDGLEIFVRAFSEYLWELLFEWNRSWEICIGRITFKGGKVMLIHSEFPNVFSFDCQDDHIAKELKNGLVNFFNSELGYRFVQNS